MTTRDGRLPGRNYSNSLRVDPSVRGGGNLLPPMLEEKNLPELFANNAEKRGELPFGRFRDIVGGTFREISWREAASDVISTAEYLRDVLGVVSGERVGVFSSTRYEWVVADLAILSLGAVSVSLYHSLTPAEAGFILWDSGVTVVFAENEEQVEKLREIQNTQFEIPENEKTASSVIVHSVRAIITFEECTVSLPNALGKLFREIPKSDSDAPEAIRKLAQPISSKDLASIVYTSGTTGAPKGVLQSHGNHLGMLDSVLSSGLMGDGRRVFLYLPLAHSFARLIAYAAMAPGGDLIFPAILDRKKFKFLPQEILKDLSASNPLIFPSVPRLFEKIMDSIVSKPGVAGMLARWAVRTNTAQKGGIKGKIAKRIGKKVATKIFGPELKYCVSGGAPISVEVLEFFRALGVLICEGYGLTETTPAMAANIPQMLRFGTVGRLFDCNEVRIDEHDGEILVRGANVAHGYLDRPLATAEAWDSEGWFRTGDIGEIDSDGFLKITDRKKDLIVTAGGKKVPPALLEGKLKNCTIISNALVYGDRRPYIVALITLNELAIQAQSKSLGVPPQASVQELAKNPKILEIINSAVSNLNQKLASYEQIKKWEVLGEDFTIEGGLLTPSLKLKKKVAVERYRMLIDSMYTGAGKD